MAQAPLAIASAEADEHAEGRTSNMGPVLTRSKPVHIRGGGCCTTTLDTVSTLTVLQRRRHVAAVECKLTSLSGGIIRVGRVCRGLSHA